MSDRKYELQELAKLAKEKVWREVLKPQLEAMRIEAELQQTEPQNEFEAVKMTHKRLERIKVINKIINLIDQSEDQLNKQK